MNDKHDIVRDLVVDGAKSSPVFGYAGLAFGGVSLPDWVAIATLIYTLILIGEKLGKLGVLSAARAWLVRIRP